jgi:hypothetical protein
MGVVATFLMFAIITAMYFGWFYGSYYK